MVIADNISYQVGKKQLLKNVSVGFQQGKLNLIIGPNGAGKSTLIKLLSGQIKPNTGSIKYGSRNIKDYNKLALAQVRAVLSQHLEFSFPLKVWEVVMMGRYPHFTGKPHAKDYKACEEAIDFFEIGDMKERDYATLSGGEKQRVQFAKVMAQIWFKQEQQRYLFLDEPLTFLDIHYQHRFMDLLVQLLKDETLTIIGIVHDLNLTARFADYVLLLNNGLVVADGSSEKVLQPAIIKEVYQVEPEVVNHNGRQCLIF